MRRGPLLRLTMLAPLLGATPSALAHDGTDIGPVVPGTLLQAHALSFLVATVFVLAAFTYLRSRWTRSGGLDAVSVMVLLGIAWVVAAVSVPTTWLADPSWKLAAAALLLGTLGLPWWIVARRWGKIRERFRGRPRSVAAAVAAALVFLVTFAFVTDMLQVATGDVSAHPSAEAFFVEDGSYGPLAFWSVAAVWVPSLKLMAQATAATGVFAVALSGLVGLSVGLLVVNLTAGSAGMMGGASLSALATSFCAGCTPVLFGGVTAVLGSGVAPVLFALGKPDLAVYNVAQVGTVWLLAGSILLALKGHVGPAD